MYRQKTSYFVPLLLLAGLYLIYLLILKRGIMPAMLFAILPAVVLCLSGLLRKHYLFFAYFIINYFIAGIGRYFPFKIGMFMLFFSVALLIILIIKGILQPQEWKRANKFLIIIWGIWFIYCFLELFNPNAIVESWFITIPNYALYPLLCSIIVPVIVKKYSIFQWLLIIWAVLTILAAAKGYWQRNRGFDPSELHWLNTVGGKTHLINTGIRFFSFFSDAAAYGASMGLSLVVFAISGFYTSKKWIKALYWISAISAGYGLLISGTRSALIIPMVGLAIYLILCRNLKAILTSVILLASIFVFFNYTTIGDSNRLIHRMRTTFDTKDASWLVRVNSRIVISKSMRDKPFGVGLGLSGVKAARFREVNIHDPLTFVAPDSWFVLLYIETGKIGILIYLTGLILILIRASYIAVFKIKNRQLQGQLYAIIAAITGILTICYASDVLNYPNGIIIYILIPILFIAPYFDKELQENGSNS